MFFLNLMGIPYPDIDADQVRELGQYVREFAADVRETHKSATAAVNDMGSVYSGYSYQALLTAWGRMSAGNMAQLDAGCEVVATALDIAADVIEMVQIVVLTELAALALLYTAMILTPAGVTAGPLLASAARRLLSSLQEMLLAYVAAEVMGNAIEPLEEQIERMFNETLYGAASDILDVPADPGELYIEPDEVLRYAGVLDDHADTMRSHADRLAEKAGGLDFATPGIGVYVGDPADTTGAPAGMPWLGNDQPTARPDLFSNPLPATQTQPPPPGGPAESARLTGSPGGREFSPPIDTNSAPVGGQRADHGTDFAGNDSPAVVGRPDVGLPVEPHPPYSMPDDRSAVTEPGRTGGDPAHSESPSSKVVYSSPQAEPMVGLGGAKAGANRASASFSESAPWEPMHSPSVPTELSGQRPAAPSDPTGKAQSGTDRAPARPAAESRSRADNKASRTPWSKAGRAAARAAYSAMRTSPVPPAVSAGETGSGQQTAGSPWSNRVGSRSADRQVVAPDTSPPAPDLPNGKSG